MTVTSRRSTLADRALVDSSAVYALLDQRDAQHERASAALQRLETEGAALVTSSYVLHESAALLQSRLGLAAVRALHERFRPVFDVHWIDCDLHDRAMAALLATGARHVSLTDWTSFELMRDLGLDTAFAFDDDFAAQGFRLVP